MVPTWNLSVHLLTARTQDLLNKLGSGNHVAEGVGALEGDVRSSYLMNSTIVGVEDTDAVLLVRVAPLSHTPSVDASVYVAVYAECI
jgi:NADH dehydrogenase (ubiquinone) Fe-S protein 1